MTIKHALKAAISRWLPNLLRRFDLVTRTNIVQASISNANLITSLPAAQRKELLVDCARGVGVAGLLHRGGLGDFCGVTADENVHRRYIYTDDWAPSFQSLVRCHCLSGRVGTYVDIGANIGLTVIPIARMPGVDCIAVEPEPQNYRLLRANAWLNDVGERIQFHNVAAMAGPGEVRMRLSAWNSGDHQVLAASTTAAESDRHLDAAEVLVPAARIDDLIFGPTPLQHPIVCKIDTQGAEVDVLRGGPRLIDEADFMIIEFWPEGLRRLGGDAATLLGMLERGFGFAEITQLDAEPHKNLTQLRSISEVVREALQLASNAGNSDYWDLVLSKRQLGSVS